MSRLCDVNVVRLLGACLTEEPRYVITEYPRQGDLAQYLRHHSPGNPSSGVPPPGDDETEDQLLLMTSRRRRPNGTSAAVLRFVKVMSLSLGFKFDVISILRIEYRSPC